ncbi:aspartate/glutamate racemase family protein [Gramella sp. KN1008]|uniref:aspartate/glutamate racemase family protein n=1 Tax=Gramella sp. KN1008 TaxID=2529298 RepID=UPI00103CA13D|nr:amino acid racemase [Gramella sp. KN1008]TBW28663.1 amino acid racemase [Gramella sp. KN1008]
MKTLGLIGGTSWHSTIVYYRLINELVTEKIGSQANPELILYSLNIELMREQDHEKINSKYLEVSEKLQQAGADAILICANTPHMTYKYIQPRLKIPVLHIGEAIGREAKRLGITRLGLLGNKPTVTGKFIPDYLQDNFGIETMLPSANDILRSHHFVSKELTQGKFTEEARKFYLEQTDLFHQKGAQGVVLGCTELPMLLDKEETKLPLIATTQLHARLAADFILEKEGIFESKRQ